MSPKEINEAIAFREAVLGEDGGRESVGSDASDLDPTTVHRFVRDGSGSFVGVGRLVAPIVVEKGKEVIETNSTIGPIVVAESARGRGVGRAILSFLEEEALASYGRNGVVRVEGWVSSHVAEGAGPFGYTVREGEMADRPLSRGVFRDVSVGTIGDALEGPPTA